MSAKKFRIAALMAASSCFLGSPVARAGYEIADLTQVGADFKGPTKVWIDYGDNRIPDEEWASFTPPPGYAKNTPRNAEFNAENTFSSPGMPAPEVLVDTIGGYTWKFIAQIQSAMWPYNTDLFPGSASAWQAAAAIPTPPPGAIKFSSNEKNQEMIFWARAGNDPGGAQITRYFITDPWGNKYIMGATGAATDDEIPPAFDAAVLPEGWQKSTGYLEETISLFPAYGAGDQAHYNLFRESGDNTFFQIEWGESGDSIARQIEGMPIWGGATGDNILGRAGDDNLIHGAEGDDTIFSLGLNDLIYGDAGSDTVVLAGNFSDYSILFFGSGGAELTLGIGGLEKQLFDVETLRFDDGDVSVSAVPEPSVFALLAGAAGLWLAWSARRRGRCAL